MPWQVYSKYLFYPESMNLGFDDRRGRCLSFMMMSPDLFINGHARNFLIVVIISITYYL